MFNFDPVILRQSMSEIDVCWKDVDNCDVYKIEDNTMGLQGKIVYWYLHEYIYVICLLYSHLLISNVYTTSSLNIITGVKIRNARYRT